MRKITLFFVALFITSVSFGQMSGTYKVGASEVAPNYTLLSAAVTDLNTLGLNGDVVLEISSDITETVNIGLINISNYTITIRPDSDTPRTITFNKSSDNAGPSGAFCFGIGMGLAWSDLVASKNLVIDGYAVGGSTRQLTIATSTTHSGFNGPFLLIDDCSNVQIKNCIIHHVGASTGSSNYGIYMRVNTSYGNKKMPSNILIENNDITCVQNTASQGIAMYANATPTGGVGTGVVIKNNIIKARTRGIFTYYQDGLEINGNEFHINQSADGVLSSAIMGNSGITGNVNIFNNKFIELKSGNKYSGVYGMRAIIASGGGTWNIYNNFFTGFDKTNATAGETMLQAIRCGSTCKIWNNTFLLNSLTNKPTNIEDPTDAQGAYCAINIAAGSPEIKNNIIISDEDGCYNQLIRGGLSTDASSYNDFYLKAGNLNARFQGTGGYGTYATFADFQTANTGNDANSISKDVTFASVSDLSLSGVSTYDLELAAPEIGAPITTDIFGNVRHTPNVYMGAHEPYDINQTKTFTVTAPQGTEHVYLAGSFTGKFWDIDEPLELTSTANPYEFTGTFLAPNDIEYKYLCHIGNWEYQEATSVNPLTVADNHIYNAADVVTYWKAVPKLKLNVSINGGIPTNLYVKGSWDSWTAPVALTASSTPLTVPAQRIKSATNAVSYTGTIGDGSTSVIYSNTEYKYYTTDLADPNWEVNTDGSARDNRWAIYPLMSDEIARFVSQISTGLGAVKGIDVRIMRTATGITATFDGTVDIELYSINGRLIEKNKANGSYSRDLEHGAYIIRINGKSTKFVR
ncbi:exported hypothetical protein [uncultured Paludibacter sp.]|nr:exported hypothetical protein [uncultured Paludibacter sp.]